MTEPTPTDELREAERRLQAAQLTGDTAALEQLLDDRGTFGPDGKCYNAERIHRRCMVRDEHHPHVQFVGPRTPAARVTRFKYDLAGQVRDLPRAKIQPDSDRVVE